MAKTKVRTTFDPATVLEVDERELVDLERQGLIHSRQLGKNEKPRKGEKAWESGKAESTDSGVITDAPNTEGGAA